MSPDQDADDEIHPCHLSYLTVSLKSANLLCLLFVLTQVLKDFQFRTVVSDCHNLTGALMHSI